MAAIENEKIYALKIRESADDGSDFGTPDADYRYLFVGEDGDIHLKDAADAVSDFAPSGGPGAFVSGELDYVQITSPVTLSGTTEGSPTTVITGGSVAYDGSTVVMIEFYAPYLQAPTNTTILLMLFEDGVQIARIGRFSNTWTGFAPVHGAVRRTPTNASHTYSVRGYSQAGDAIVGAGAGGAAPAFSPAFLRIIKA